MALKDWELEEANKNYILWKNKKTKKQMLILLQEKVVVVDKEFSRKFKSGLALNKFTKAYMRKH